MARLVETNVLPACGLDAVSYTHLPTEKQREASVLQLTVAASAEKIVMIEAGANEVDEATMQGHHHMAVWHPQHLFFHACRPFQRVTPAA